MGVLVTVVSTVYAAHTEVQKRRAEKKAQRKKERFEARSAELQSKALLEEAAEQGEVIRGAGELLGKKQAAFSAKAGLKLGKGTAKDIQEETKRLSEKDASTKLRAARRESKRLLETFGGRTQEEIDRIVERHGTEFPIRQGVSLTEGGSQEEIDRQERVKREEEADITALESESEGATVLSSNFIKTKKKKDNLFAL